MKWALAATFALAVLATWPMPLTPATALLGHPGNDVWNHVWGYWWVADEISKGQLPLSTDLQRFPGTSALFFIDTFGALWTLPVQWVAGPVVAYNVSVFVCMWTAGMAAWALARHVLRGWFGPQDADITALIAAAAFVLSPHLLAQAYNGITETLTSAGLPFATLAMLRLYERPGAWRAVVAGTAGAFCMLANWYYGLFSVIGSAILLLTLAATRRERIHWRAIPGAAGGAAFLALALVAPVLVGFSRTLESDTAIVKRDPEFVWNSLISHNMTDVVSIFRPGHVYSPDLKALHGEDLLIVTYVGWTLLLLAGAGLWRLRRWRDRLPWMVWVAVFASLMLGPYLYVAGEYVTISDRRIPLPFLAFFDAFPLFSRISHPFRFVVPVQLGLGVLAAAGLGALPRWTRPVAVVAMMVEFLTLSPAPWPLPLSSAAMPAYCADLAKDPVAGAVLDLPITVANLERAVYLYWQTVHGRPIPYSLNEPMPETLERSHLAKAIFIAEGGHIDHLPPMLAELDLIVAGRALADLGFRYVVFHERMYPPDRAKQVLTLLRVGFGDETSTTPDGEHIWRLEIPDLVQ